MKIYDAAVVGAGPAGAHAALLLARAGLSVVLVEKKRLPRAKTCGGGLPYKAANLLACDASPALEVEISGAHMEFCGKERFEIIPEGGIGWMVTREKFDYLLAQAAADAGAELMEGVEVLGFDETESSCALRTGAGPIRCRYVIGADGVNGKVARCAGQPVTERGFALEAEVCVDEESLKEQGRFATFDFGCIPGGYGWVFPKKDRLSVGVGTTSGDATDIRGRLETFMKTQKTLRRIEEISISGYPVPLGRSRRAFGTERVFLAGDAAGLADAFLGEGIFYALKSGEIAAGAVMDGVSGKGTGAKSYAKAINAAIGRDLDSARIIAKLFYLRPRLSHALLSSPRLSRLFMQVARGDLTHTQCLIKAIAALSLAMVGR